MAIPTGSVWMSEALGDGRMTKAIQCTVMYAAEYAHSPKLDVA